MQNLDGIIERVHESFEDRTKVRDQALKQARLLTRHCANAIRATHRGECEVAREHLAAAATLATALYTDTAEYADIYHAGYTQDALKEYAEAKIVYALIHAQPLPIPEELNLEYSTYLKGLAEAVGELRRRCLDILRHNHSDEAERLLENMDEIYTVLVTIDYPDAITGGLRRLTDIVRSIVERTRGDLTISLRQARLEDHLQAFAQKLPVE